MELFDYLFISRKDGKLYFSTESKEDKSESRTRHQPSRLLTPVWLSASNKVAAWFDLCRARVPNSGSGAKRGGETFFVGEGEVGNLVW